MRITPVPSILCGGYATSPNLPSTTSGLSNISRPTDPNPYDELLEAEGVYFVDLNLILFT
jgi:hypothetical protein